MGIGWEITDLYDKTSEVAFYTLVTVVQTLMKFWWRNVMDSDVNIILAQKPLFQYPSCGV